MQPDYVSFQFQGDDANGFEPNAVPFDERTAISDEVGGWGEIDNPRLVGTDTAGTDITSGLIVSGSEFAGEFSELFVFTFDGLVGKPNGTPWRFPEEIIVTTSVDPMLLELDCPTERQTTHYKRALQLFSYRRFRQRLGSTGNWSRRRRSWIRIL